MPDCAESIAKSVAALHAQRREAVELARRRNLPCLLHARAATNLIQLLSCLRCCAVTISVTHAFFDIDSMFEGRKEVDSASIVSAVAATICAMKV